MSNDIASKLIDAAKSFTGLRYQLDPPPDAISTIDCSLLIIKAAEKAGIPFANGVRTAEQIRQVCIPVDWDDVTPGTLLFFEGTYDAGPVSADGHIASHVGISLGAGTKRMWDAHERDGADVAVTDISTAYWQDKLFEARRPPQLAAADPAAPTATQLRGIDVSSNNGAVDWAAVAGSGIGFAFVKATGGSWYRNPQFARDWLAMKAAGLVRGAYHFAFESSGQTFPGDGPEAEAQYFVAELNRAGGLSAGDLLALDLEDGNGPLGDWCLRWLQRVEALTGVRAFCYTGAWFAGPHGLGSVPALSSYPLWLADYDGEWPDPIPPWKTVTLWQSSSNGRVSGVSGDVDLDQFAGSVDELRALGKGGPPAEWALANPDVGPGILTLMAEDGTTPATHSTFLPLGRSPALIEEAVGLNGTVYRWSLPTGRHWRYPAA